MTTSLKALLGGGSSASLDAQDIQFVQASKTWTAARAGRYRITAIGAGGAGAAVSTVTSSGDGYAQGGCAGGLAQKTITLAVNDALVIAIGSGGVGGTSNYGTVVNGGAGGNTTVTGPGISLTANGGPGGVGVSDGTTVLPALTGGTATGGTYNTTGGGAIARPTATTYGGQGGAAVGIFTTVGFPATSVSSLANGGSGVGGVPSYDGGFPYGGGGSFGNGSGQYGGPGLLLTINGTGAGTTYASISPNFFSMLNGQGGYSGQSGGWGGGGGSGAATGGSGGLCAGGGTGYSSAANAFGGQGGLGWGGGGAGYTRGSSWCSAKAGNGGAGLVVIEFLGA